MPIDPRFPIYDPIACLTDRVRADLLAQQVFASAADAAERVQYGPALEGHQLDAPRVHFDLAPAYSADAIVAGRKAPGAALEADVIDFGKTVGITARSLWSVQDQFVVTLYARVPESGEEAVECRGADPARLARLAGFELRARVLGAFYRIAMRSIVVLSGEWLEPKDDEWHYGSVLEMVCGLQTSVPDVPLITMPITEIDGTVTAQFLDGPPEVGGTFQYPTP